MNELNNDKNLREAVNRREQQLQPVSDDLNNRLLQRLEEEQAPAKHKPLWLYAAVAAAACIALFLVFHFTQEQSSQQPVMAQQMEEQATKQVESPAAANEPVEAAEPVDETPEPVVEDMKQTVAKARVQPVRKSVKKQQTVTKLVELIPTAEEPTNDAEFSIEQDPLVAMTEHEEQIRMRGKRLQQAIEDKLND